jgi:hypothetical protein
MLSLKKLYRRVCKRISYFFKPTAEPPFDIVNPPLQAEMEEYELDLVDPPQHVNLEEYELDLVDSSQEVDLEQPELNAFPDPYHFSPVERQDIWYHHSRHGNIDILCYILPPGGA